jgi:3-(3-hydroxy-phenyl)propionate hydroxylase
VRGNAPEELLDTYHDDRHPVAARVLENTRAQTSLLEPGDNATALRETFRRLMHVEEANERISAEISGLDVCYPSGAEHAVVGRRILDCDTVARVSASCTVGSWRLPVLGRVPVPAALLVRPDGYVAWAGDAGSTRGFYRAAERIGAAHRLGAGRCS